MAKEETKAPVKTEVKAQPKVKDVPLGVGTINDHEKRITLLEAAVAELTKK